MKYKIFDSFAGVGGIRLGFELASSDFKTIYAVDFNEQCKLVISELEIYGYYICDLVMNSCEYTDIPQNRERIFIVGFLNKNDFIHFAYPEKLNKKKNITDFLEKKVDKKYYYTKLSMIYEKLEKDVTEKMLHINIEDFM